MKRKRRSREEVHAHLMRTDSTYRRLADLIEARRTDADREAYPLGTEAFSTDVTRRLQERTAHDAARRRESS
jgi:ferredoxin-NADP reductase